MQAIDLSHEFFFFTFSIHKVACRDASLQQMSIHALEFNQTFIKFSRTINFLNIYERR